MEASPSCRYLGVEMDSKLHWGHHHEKVESKATKRLSALSSLASSTWGTGLINLRQVYRAMIVPQMLYGCSAWHIPGVRGKMSGSAIGAITRIQRYTAHHHGSLSDHGGVRSGCGSASSAYTAATRTDHSRNHYAH